MPGNQRFLPAAQVSLAPQALVPVYRIENGLSPHAGATEAHLAVQTVETITDRLHRLTDAYGAWRHFEAGAYFDLTREQAAYLVRVTERVSTVHVDFFADLLLPSFQRAVTFWAGQFSAAFNPFTGPITASQPALFDDDFLAETQPTMAAHWAELVAVVDEVRATLEHDPSFIATVATRTEQAHWRAFWQTDPPSALSPALTPALHTVPSLTLAFDFPLPAYRQSGRVRRLHRNREREQRRGRSGRT